MYYKFLLFFSISCVPSFVFGASLSLTPEALPIEVGVPVNVSLSVTDSKNTLNALEGNIRFDSTVFDFVSAKTPDSVISFWIQYPKECGEGIICFSGISPGGFSGVSNNLVDIQFLPKEAGTTTIASHSVRLLRHDGRGTDEVVTQTAIALSVEPNYHNVDAPIDRDYEAPEVFSPIVTTDPDVYGGDFVLVFTTTDKQSGVAQYFVKEVPFLWLAPLFPWQSVDSPYRLNNQDLSSHILVKASDFAGNERIMHTLPTTPWVPSRHYILLLIAPILLLSFFVLKHRRSN